MYILLNRLKISLLIINYIQNAFSNRLATSGFNMFSMFVVDLLHEVEIGVWRSLFIHLLRIFECIGPTLRHKLDERFVSFECGIIKPLTA